MVLVIISLLNPTILSAEVGKVTEQSGPTEIKRSSAMIPSALSLGVEMNDVITTANAKAGITFKDNTKVQITEHSKLSIDTFVYDGERKTGKLGIKMALGTIKYASGQIAKSDPQQVVVTTPTATIGVRGTDFSSTVDEIGRSTIVLLPSCPAGWKNVERDCVVGAISVTTDAGTIFLTRAFEAVSVQSSMTQPKSAILNLSMDQINNMIIVTPPQRVSESAATVVRQKDALDVDLLGQDFLKYDGLTKNYLEEDNKLSKNYLDTDYLVDFILVANTQIMGNELDEFSQLLPKYDPRTGLKFNIENDFVNLSRESLNSYAEIKVPTTSALTTRFAQDGIDIKQMVNSAGTTTITIKQSQ